MKKNVLAHLKVWTEVDHESLANYFQLELSRPEDEFILWSIYIWEWSGDHLFKAKSSALFRSGSEM